MVECRKSQLQIESFYAQGLGLLKLSTIYLATSETFLFLTHIDKARLYYKKAGLVFVNDG